MVAFIRGHGLSRFWPRGIPDRVEQSPLPWSRPASGSQPGLDDRQVNLGVLAPGGYAFRMYALSREYGHRIIADTAKPFTVS